MAMFVMDPVVSERMERKAAKTPEQALMEARNFKASTGRNRRCADGRAAAAKLARMSAHRTRPMPLSDYEQRLRSVWRGA